MDDVVAYGVSGDGEGLLVAALFVIGTALAAVSWESALVVLLAMSLGETHLGLDFGFQLMGYTASPLDFLAIGLSVAATFRILTTGGLNRTQLLWLVILGYGGIRFIGGVTDFGLATAVSFYRQSFYAASALFYAATIDWSPPRLDRLVKIWLFLGVVLTSATLLDWLLGDVIPRPSDWRIFLRNAFDQQRVLPAASAFTIAEAGVIGLAVWSQARPSAPMRVISIVLLTVSFALFHRSVWVATLVGMLTLVAFSRDVLLRVAPFLALGLLGSGAIWMTRQGVGDEVLSNAVQSALAEPFRGDSSIAWRVSGWELLLERAFSSGPTTIIFGAGYGAGYERQIGWSTVFYSPHNFYIVTLLDTGMIGLSLWVYGFWRIGLGMFRQTSAAMAAWRPALIPVLAMIIVYNIPYNHLAEQGFLLGVLAIAATRDATMSWTGSAPTATAFAHRRAGE